MMKLYLLKSESGFATLVALIMVGMLTLIGLAAMSTSDDEVTIAGNGLQEMRAFYAAEAGLEKVAADIQYIFDSTGMPPTNMPKAETLINGCAVVFGASDDGPATQQILTNGTLTGLNALVKSFSLSSTGVSSIENAKVVLSQSFETALVPIFQFAVFYQEDLEIAPGPDMTLMGRVHSNGSMWLQAGGSLTVDGNVTAAGNIHHGRKGPGGVSSGDVLIRNEIGGYSSMKDGTEWLESTDSYWYDSSVARWQGRVQDSAHGQQALSVPVNGADGDPHVLIEKGAGNQDSYEHKSTLKFIDRQAYQYLGGVWTNVTADMEAKGIIEFANDRFTNQRQNDARVDVMELDIQKMYDDPTYGDNSVIYYSDQTTDYPALRLKNGDELGAPLTIASENPVYTLGDYNSVKKQPAAILTDAITFLSAAWSDAQSGGYYGNRNASETTVNASFLTGNVETTESSYSGGFENLPRFLEDWGGTDFNWSGSMVCLWESVQADKPWRRPYKSYYSPPNRKWAYDSDLNDPNKLPPESPAVRIFQRTGWKQEDVGQQL